MLRQACLGKPYAPASSKLPAKSQANSQAQELTGLAKALWLLALVLACFTIWLDASVSVPPAVSNIMGQKHRVFLGLVLVLQGVLVTYDGWYAPICFVQEDLEAARNPPHSMIGTALFCMSFSCW
jgi:hypothetical protein